MKSTIISVFAAITLLVVSGCVSEPNCFAPGKQQNSMQQSFSDETYIWESFIFPKNKAESK